MKTEIQQIGWGYLSYDQKVPRTPNKGRGWNFKTEKHLGEKQSIFTFQGVAQRVKSLQQKNGNPAAMIKMSFPC